MQSSLINLLQQAPFMSARSSTPFAVLCFALALLLPPAASARAEPQLNYGPEVVQLTGKIYFEGRYGPPNYGETPEIDRIETILLLELDGPVTVIGDDTSQLNNTTFANVWRIQVSDPSGFVSDDMTGRRLTFEGTLFQAHTGRHHTNVLLDLTKIIADQPLQYDPESVYLVGIVEVEWHDVPPSMPELAGTGAKLAVPFLRLDTPFTVLADTASVFNTRTYRNVKRLQLIDLADAALAMRESHPVTVEGRLIQRRESDHHTDVVLLVTRLVAAAE